MTSLNWSKSKYHLGDMLSVWDSCKLALYVFKNLKTFAMIAVCSKVVVLLL